MIGCASGPTFTDYAKTLPPLKQGEGRLWFYRNSTWGTAIQPDVKLNGRAIGAAKPLGFFCVDRPAGDYQIEVSTVVATCLSGDAYFASQ
jgi:hypothetical protein